MINKKITLLSIVQKTIRDNIESFTKMFNKTLSEIENENEKIQIVFWDEKKCQPFLSEYDGDNKFALESWIKKSFNGFDETKSYSEEIEFFENKKVLTIGEFYRLQIAKINKKPITTTDQLRVLCDYIIKLENLNFEEWKDIKFLINEIDENNKINIKGLSKKEIIIMVKKWYEI